jgi:hypothetical protein
MKAPSMAIPDEMKQSDASIENTFGLVPGDGSQNTSSDTVLYPRLHVIHTNWA